MKSLSDEPCKGATSQCPLPSPLPKAIFRQNILFEVRGVGRGHRAICAPGPLGAEGVLCDCSASAPSNREYDIGRSRLGRKSRSLQREINLDHHLSDVTIKTVWKVIQWRLANVAFSSTTTAQPTYLQIIFFFKLVESIVAHPIPCRRMPFIIL